MTTITIKEWQRSHILNLITDYIRRTPKMTEDWEQSINLLKESIENGSNKLQIPASYRKAILDKVIESAIRDRSFHSENQNILIAAGCFYYDNTGEWHYGLLISPKR